MATSSAYAALSIDDEPSVERVSSVERPPFPPLLYRALACTGVSVSIAVIAAVGFVLLSVLAAPAPVPVAPPRMDPTRRMDWTPVLVLSDVHLDVRYVTNTGSPHCKTSSNGFAAHGTYHCDSPMALLQSALRQMQRVLPCTNATAGCTRAAAILLPGDLFAHCEWQAPDPFCSLPDVLVAMDAVLAAVRTAFPWTPIIVSPGNNDIYPDYLMPIDVLHSAWVANVTQVFAKWRVWSGPKQFCYVLFCLLVCSKRVLIVCDVPCNVCGAPPWCSSGFLRPGHL